MPIPTAILPRLNAGESADAAAAHPAPPKPPEAESFDRLMKRTLAPAKAPAKAGHSSPPPTATAQPPTVAVTAQNGDAVSSAKKAAPAEDSRDADPAGKKTVSEAVSKKDGHELFQTLVALLAVPVDAASLPTATGNAKPVSLGNEATAARLKPTGPVLVATPKTVTSNPVQTLIASQTTADKSAVSKSVPEPPEPPTAKINDRTDLLELLNGSEAVEAKAGKILPANPALKADAKLGDATPILTAADRAAKISQPLPNAPAPGDKPDAKATLPASGVTLPASSPIAEAPPRSEPAEISGIAVAKQELPMKKAAQTDKVAGQTEQVLPGNHVLAAGKTGLPANAGFKPESAPSSGLETTVSAGAAAQSSVGHSLVAAGQVVSASAVKASAATVEQTHQLVAMNAVRLHETGATSLRVVLKPDAGTQLSLELRQRDNGVEARAILQTGDFAQLNHHWPELQQRLEQRGVRLAALTSEQNFTATGDGQHQFQQPARQSAGDETFATGRDRRFAPSVPANLSRATESAGRSAYRGWETWA
jgi:hypothetical protein